MGQAIDAHKLHDLNTPNTSQTFDQKDFPPLQGINPKHPIGNKFVPPASSSVSYADMVRGRNKNITQIRPQQKDPASEIKTFNPVISRPADKPCYKVDRWGGSEFYGLQLESGFVDKIKRSNSPTKGRGA